MSEKGYSCFVAAHQADEEKTITIAETIAGIGAPLELLKQLTVKQISPTDKMIAAERHFMVVGKII